MAAGDAVGGRRGLPDDVYNAVMMFEPNAIEIAMSDLRRVLRAEARHASKMRKRGAVPNYTRLMSQPASVVLNPRL